ncbi:MAG: response regulator [Methanocella sp.]
MTDNTRASVAIVDDDPQLVRTYELLFKHRQVPVSFIAYDSYSALIKFNNASPRPGVVIIDYRMPYKNGLDLMIEILKIEPDTKIIFISADDSIGQSVLDAGADVFLKKPTSIKEIMDSVSLVSGSSYRSTL